MAGTTWPLDQVECVAIVEAPIDALSLAAAGKPTLATQGTSCPDWLPLAFKTVLLGHDNDAPDAYGQRAGDMAAAGLIPASRSYGAEPERWRPVSKDWNQDLQDLGLERLRRRVAGDNEPIEPTNDVAETATAVHALPPGDRIERFAPEPPAEATAEFCPGDEPVEPRERAEVAELLRWLSVADLPQAPLQQSAPDFLTVATPGAGKTTYALVAALMVLVDRPGPVVVVTPTAHLKTQWAQAAARLQLHLDPAWSAADGALPADMHGVVTTYQQVALNPAAVRRLAVGAFVILDEVHHVGEDRDWGAALQAAFSVAARHLSLSGTPFRNDTRAIPFVRYHADEAIPDVEYGYGDALRDGGVVRPVYFPVIGGVMEWSASDACSMRRRSTIHRAPRLPINDCARRCRSRATGCRVCSATPCTGSKKGAAASRTPADW